MLNPLATNRNQSPEPTLAHPEPQQNSEGTKQPPLPALYTPFAEKPALSEPPYKPYTEKPAEHEPPYEPYKGI